MIREKFISTIILVFHVKWHPNCTKWDCTIYKLKFFREAWCTNTFSKLLMLRYALCVVYSAILWNKTSFTTVSVPEQCFVLLANPDFVVKHCKHIRNIDLLIKDVVFVKFFGRIFSYTGCIKHINPVKYIYHIFLIYVVSKYWYFLNIDFLLTVPALTDPRFNWLVSCT